MTTIFLKSPQGGARAVELLPGSSVMQSLKAAGVEIEASCEGSLACATCHVVLDAASFARLDPPDEAEERMLDTLARITRTSRLSCQIRPRADVERIDIEEIA